MVNALTPFAVHAGTEELMLHQALHGYSEGHRLIESSIPIPDDLKRLMQRMSDLSGTSVVSGFQDYLTGYPLQSLGAYALAKTWYAAEMSRPGCVWTHTLIIPETVMAKIASLAALRTLFRRPNAQSSEVYSKPIVLEHKSASGFEESFTDQQMKLQAFMAAHYEKESRPLIVGSAHSHEYIGLIFAACGAHFRETTVGCPVRANCRDSAGISRDRRRWAQRTYLAGFNSPQCPAMGGPRHG
jgi:hypothetical protein